MLNSASYRLFPSLGWSNTISLTHLIAYNVEPFESLGTQWSVKGLTLALRRDIASLLLPAAEFSNCTVRDKLKYHPHHLDTWHSTTVRFRNASFHAYSLNPISTLKAGDAPVAPLVLHGLVGDIMKNILLIFQKWKFVRMDVCSTFMEKLLNEYK